jgi:hypothetical protein
MILQRERRTVEWAIMDGYRWDVKGYLWMIHFQKANEGSIFLFSERNERMHADTVAPYYCYIGLCLNLCQQDDEEFI